METAQPITVSAMILCDGIATDAVTGKTTIVGSSSDFRVRQLPATLPPFAVFVKFSDLTRRVRLELQIRTADEEVIAELPPTFVDPVDPLTNIEFDARFANLEVDDIGHFFIRLLADSLYIMDVRFTVSFEEAENA
jgi:hypothetical protein